MNEWKSLVSCAFIVDGDFDIDTICKINNEIEQIVYKYMLENNINKCERTFMSNQVKDMIDEYDKYMEKVYEFYDEEIK